MLKIFSNRKNEISRCPFLLILLQNNKDPFKRFYIRIILLLKFKNTVHRINRKGNFENKQILSSTSFPYSRNPLAILVTTKALNNFHTKPTHLKNISLIVKITNTSNFKIIILKNTTINIFVLRNNTRNFKISITLKTKHCIRKNF